MAVGRVLYDNIFKNGNWSSITYSGTVVSGFDLAHAYDWRDFTAFRVSSGSAQTIQITNSSGVDQTINTLFLFHANFSSAATITVSLEAPNGTVVLGPLTLAPAGNFKWGEFPNTVINHGQVVELTISGLTVDLDIHQLMVGQVMKLALIDGTTEFGQWQGIAPPSLQGAVQPRNNMSVNGSFLGRNTRAQFRQGSIELTPVSPAWVRSTWDPFVNHAKTKTWAYAWDFDDYPDEIVFCATSDDGITPAENAGPRNFMSVQMDFVAIRSL